MIINRRSLMSLFGAAAVLDAPPLKAAVNAPVPITGVMPSEKSIYDNARENQKKLQQAERIAAGDFTREDLQYTKTDFRVYHYQSLKSLSDCGRQFLLAQKSESQYKKDLIKRAQTEIKRFKKNGFINWVTGMEEDL